ncbi:MAG: beta-propeller fold lactonase family protein [Actinomycetota bacterium]
MQSAAVFAQTNDARGNELVAFTREDDGRLVNAGSYSTGGRGNGTPHLPSQGSIAIDPEGRRLLVANAGSDELSLFSIAGPPKLLAHVASGGERPVSITIHGDRVYVLNAGNATIVGFTLEGERIEPLSGTLRALADGSDPAQIAFTPAGDAVVITDRATNSIVVHLLDEDGLPAESKTYAASGVTPYGFDFAGDVLVVTEAFGGQIGAAAASSYSLDGGELRPVSPSVGNTRSEVCWAIVSADRRFAWVTNFGDGTISRYAIGSDGSLELADAVAATTVEGMKGIRDAARSTDGRFFYALDADAHRVFAYRVGDEGRLEAIGSTNGLPGTVAGLAAV